MKAVPLYGRWEALFPRDKQVQRVEFSAPDGGVHCRPAFRTSQRTWSTTDMAMKPWCLRQSHSVLFGLPLMTLALGTTVSTMEVIT